MKMKLTKTVNKIKRKKPHSQATAIRKIKEEISKYLPLVFPPLNASLPSAPQSDIPQSGTSSFIPPSIPDFKTEIIDYEADLRTIRANYFSSPTAPKCLSREDERKLFEMRDKAPHLKNEIRNIVIMLNQGLVELAIMRTKIDKYYNHLKHEDYVQECNFYLITKIFEGFDPTLNLRFSTYAMKILMRYIREIRAENESCCRIPEHTQKRIYLAIKKDKEKLYGAEVAERAKVTEGTDKTKRVEEIENADGVDSEHNAILKDYRKGLLLLFQIPSGNFGLNKNEPDILHMDYFPDNQTPLPDESAESKEFLSQSSKLFEMVNQLPEKEKYIVTRYYGLDGEEPETYEEIGKKFGLSRERMRQLENKARVKLKGMLQG